MKTSSELQYKVFDWLRFPLIVGVVFIHSFGQPFDFPAVDFGQLSGTDCYNLFRVSISKVLTHVCVPTFYLISGYLFFVGLEKWDNNIYIRKLKKRCKSLLAPFLIWNTIALVLPLLGAFRHDGWIGVQGFLQEHGYWHLYWDSNQWNLDRTNLLGGVILPQARTLFPCGSCVI
jgi:peptidoglycan/LPS O-acetylase OafA/YrhL